MSSLRGVTGTQTRCFVKIVKIVLIMKTSQVKQKHPGAWGVDEQTPVTPYNGVVSAMERGPASEHADVRRNLKCVTKNKRRQTPQATYCGIPFT